MGSFADSCTIDGSCEISSIVNFLITNKSKLVQLCLDDDKMLDLKKFDIVFYSILNNNIMTALTTSTRITTMIFNILDINKIK